MKIIIFFALLICVSGKPTLNILRDIVKDVLQIPDVPQTQNPIFVQPAPLMYPYPQGPHPPPHQPYAYNTPTHYQYQAYPSPYGQRNEKLEMYPPASGPAGIYDNNLYLQDPPLQIDNVTHFIVKYFIQI
ncbi:hypothetical protein DOY81_015160 [Sarcophaga bullata]|nr:hypothetical protein DOY81_015160 [Sarcophaga bullata]